MKSALCMIPLLLAGIWPAAAALADDVRVAVASNFAPVLEALAPAFEQQSGHRLVLSPGASGRLYTQIVAGAPFDVFLAADNERPRLLVEADKAVRDSVFPYAIGKLVLWSATLDLSREAGATLKAGTFRHLAIASPSLAPYGTAAREVLERMQIWESLQSKLVTGENIAQTLQFIDSGNAELGFIAEAQWLELPAERQGQPWHVPTDLHTPIVQEGVLLRDTPATRSLLDFLQSDATRTMIGHAGYDLP